MNKVLITMVVAVLVLAAACVAPPAQPAAVASDTTRVSVVERTLAAVETESMTPSSQIFAARVTPAELDDWLRNSEIATAAAIEGRTEEAIRQEWDAADIHAIPVPALASDSLLWVVEIRGIRHQPPPGGVTITPAPGTPMPEPFYYDNVYVVFEAFETTRRRQVYFARSTDNGATWSTVSQLSPDTATHAVTVGAWGRVSGGAR